LLVNGTDLHQQIVAMERAKGAVHVCRGRVGEGVEAGYGVIHALGQVAHLGLLEHVQCCMEAMAFAYRHCSVLFACHFYTPDSRELFEN